MRSTASLADEAVPRRSMIFLAYRDRYTQRTVHRNVFDRLRGQPGCEDIRYRPSRRRPRCVIADVDTTTFLGTQYPVDETRLESRFWYPAAVGYAFYRLNWIEPSRKLCVGVHRDADHPDLGPCHVQLDHDGETVDREPAQLLDRHPLAILETRLGQLPELLAAIAWRGGEPRSIVWHADRCDRPG